MNRIKKWIQMDLSAHRIDALDGVRALCILIVLWFHFWQQTWLMPVYELPFLRHLGITRINPDLLRRAGYVFVDMMLFLSAFLLFLPHARAMILGERTPGIREFYVKRAARIFPTYYFTTFVFLIIALIGKSYINYLGVFDTRFFLKDLFSHLTFTQMFDLSTYVGTHLNVPIWTVAVEVQFYLVFPLLVWGMRKARYYAPVLLLGVACVGCWYIYGYGWNYILAAPQANKNIIMVINQFPAFLPTFVMGIACAWLYILYVRYVPAKRLFGILWTILSLFSLYLIWKQLQTCTSAQFGVEGVNQSQIWQLMQRIPFNAVLVLFVLSTSMASGWYRKFWGNGAFRWIAGISFNLYIWHQPLMVWIRRSYGYASGQDVANAGANMQWALTFVGLGASILVAWIVTRFVERPFAKLILDGYQKYKDRKLQISEPDYALSESLT
ncbi:MAG: acyltransferase [Clostridiales bacterium]|nr:acyltransferase [Clostridiales bacterium]